MASLYKALSAIKNETEFENFFEELFSHSELVKIRNRWSLFEMLIDGKQSQREISKRTGVAIATVSRAADVTRQLSSTVRIVYTRTITTENLKIFDNV
jgi:Trp operon repressor